MGGENFENIANINVEHQIKGNFNENMNLMFIFEDSTIFEH